MSFPLYDVPTDCPQHGARASQTVTTIVLGSLAVLEFHTGPPPRPYHAHHHRGFSLQYSLVQGGCDSRTRPLLTNPAPSRQSFLTSMMEYYSNNG